MSRDDSRSSRDPDRKRDGPSLEGPRRNAQRGANWLLKRGRSGYGVESIRPHLRAQIEMQKLWHPSFPPENDEDES